MSHGTSLRDTLKTLGFKVSWTQYDACEHWMKESEGIDDTANLMVDLCHHSRTDV